jgi:chemotaxis response regulator CheB
VGIVLSGNLSDGTAGLLAIKQAGGIAVIQRPDTARYPGMPLSAMEHAAADYVVPPSDMSELIQALAVEPADPSYARVALGG